jgi:hypothetical protein
MSKLSNTDDPLTSALKEGIVIGIVATMRQHQLIVNKQVIANVLRQQQGWSENDVDYFLNWLLIFNIGD